MDFQRTSATSSPGGSRQAHEAVEKIRPEDDLYLHLFDKKMIINVLVELEGRVETEALRRMLESKVLGLKRFRQRVGQDRKGGWACWETDRSFSLDRHLCVVEHPERLTPRRLREVMDELVNRPLDPAHPLWEVVLLQNGPEESFILYRIHHAITDGVGLIAVALFATDSPDGIDIPGLGSFRFDGPEKGEREEGEEGLISLLTRQLARIARAAGKDFMRDPRGFGKQAWERAEELRTQTERCLATLGNWLSFRPDPLTPIHHHKIARSLRVEWLDPPIPIEGVKRIASATGTNFNSVVFAIIAGTLRRYLQEKGQSRVEDLRIRWQVPFSLKSLHDRFNQSGLQKLGNHLTVVLFDCPVHVADPLERIRATNEAMTRLKNAPDPYLAALNFRLLSRLPRPLARLYCQKVTEYFSVSVSSVPGPSSPLDMAGRRIRSVKWFISLAGFMGLNFQVLTLHGGCHVAISVDPDLIADPDRLVELLRQELASTLQAVDQRSGEAAQKATRSVHRSRA